MTCGVYKLLFKGTDKVYIGQGLNIKIRLHTHTHKFKSGTAAKKLLGAYVQFGMPTMELIEECLPQYLNDIEDKHILLYNSVDNGFNTRRTATGGSNLPGEMNGRSKYTNLQIIQVFTSLIANKAYTFKEISEATGVSTSIVGQVSAGTCHRWLSTSYPEEYIQLMSLKGTRSSRALSSRAKGIVYPDIVSPEGTRYSVENTKAFALTHDLHQGALYEVLKGKASHHKGWKLAP